MSQTINIIVQLTGLFATVSVPAIQLPSSGSVSWTEVTGKPSTFPPSEHQHEISQIIGLALALADKANVSQLADKADLVNGVIPTDQIPAIAITEFLGDVPNQAAMLALDGQKGDWCTRQDLNLSYVLIGNDPTSLASWRHIETPGSPVSSVNGQVGAVVLGKASVGLGNVDNTADMQKPVSTAQALALAGKADVNHNHTSTQISDWNPAVLGAVLTGFITGANTPIDDKESILSALAKLQGQISARALSLHGHSIGDISGLSTTLQNLNTFIGRKYIDTTDSAPVNGTQNNTVVRTVLIPGGTIQVGYLVRFRARARKTTSGTCTLRVYANVTPTIGGVQILQNAAANTNTMLQAKRDAAIKPGSITEVFSASSSAVTDDVNANATVSTLNVDWSVDQYIVYALQNSVSGDTSILSFNSVIIDVPKE